MLCRVCPRQRQQTLASALLEPTVQPRTQMLTRKTSGPGDESERNKTWSGDGQWRAAGGNRLCKDPEATRVCGGSPKPEKGGRMRSGRDRLRLGKRKAARDQAREMIAGFGACGRGDGIMCL